jgi:hypothetical protein
MKAASGPRVCSAFQTALDIANGCGADLSGPPTQDPLRVKADISPSPLDVNYRAKADMNGDAAHPQPKTAQFALFRFHEIVN